MSYGFCVEADFNQKYTDAEFGNAQTVMMQDIAASQTLQGADFTTSSGNATCTWHPGSGTTAVDGMAAITPDATRILMPARDGGGADAYDLSAYSNRPDV